ncbi:MAG: DUF4838 domain-containing protein, partial [Thermoguttaceae bacterium]|nr:DUF4838 domain-containing protein [Thermoguttaceae bacterium]
NHPILGEELERAMLKAALFAPLAAPFASLARDADASKAFKTRGVILDTNDLSTLNWPLLARDAGLTTIGTHIRPGQVKEFLAKDAGKLFLDRCAEYGINVEHELHAVGELLPRELFAKNPELFRMDADGERVGDWNCCPSSPRALEIIAENAVATAKICRATTERYFYWIDDGQPLCACPKCREFSASEQALLIENAIVAALRSEISEKASLAHLAYYSTMTPPKKVAPADGIFLEFAPYERIWDKPLADGAAGREGKMNHAETLAVLDANLKVFPVETAQTLEYWLDLSLFSGYKKPTPKLPWRPEICKSDVATYAARGIRNFTTFAVYVDGEYEKRWGDLSFVDEYGAILAAYKN